MKSKKFFRSAAIIGFFLLVLPNLSKAQALCSGYAIINTTTCTVKVDYTLTCGSLTCFSASGVSISPGHQITLPDCDACDCRGVTVALRAVDTTTMNVGVSVTTTTASYTSSTCTGTINWTTTNTKIN